MVVGGVDRIRFVTHNRHKFREARTILARFGLEVEWVEMEYPEVQADALEEVALFSARWLLDRVDPPFFIEDAGLFIDALRGFPGPYSSFAFRTIGNEGILKLMDGVLDRGASFKSVVAVALDRNSEPTVLVGETPGRIAESIRGGGWGFDPIFEPLEPGGLTYGELGEDKNRYSHRYRALRRLGEWLSEGRKPL